MGTVWITPDDDAHWLALRAGFVSSTESASLFPIPPEARPKYLPTAFELWHIKRGGMESGFEETPRTARGKRMEWPIAQEVAEMMGWTVEPLKQYAHRTDVRMGASFDARVVCPERGPGLMEVKLVDWSVIRRHWETDEAAPHIEIQVQHQLEVADRYEWACIAAWSGTEPRVLIRERDREMGAGIRAAVAEFWSWNEPPEPDYARDGDTLKRLYPEDDGSAFDADEEPGLARELAALADQLDAARALADVTKADIERCESRIRRILERHTRAEVPGFEITARAVKASPPKTVAITPAMVGQTITTWAGRKPYRPITIKRR